MASCHWRILAKSKVALQENLSGFPAQWPGVAFPRRQGSGKYLAGVLWSWKCHRGQQELPGKMISRAEWAVTHLWPIRKNDGELLKEYVREASFPQSSSSRIQKAPGCNLNQQESPLLFSKLLFWLQSLEWRPGPSLGDPPHPNGSQSTNAAAQQTLN